jgi:hypothetical protein
LSTRDAQAFKWLQFEEGIKQSAESGKPLVVYFYHLQSTRIREDKKVWMHPLLQQFYDKFVFGHVEIEYGVETVNRLGVKSFPSVLFFDPKGRELINHRIEEEILKVTILAARMNRVLKDVEDFTLLESQMKLLKDNPKMVLMYAKGLTDRTQFSQAEEHFTRLFQWKDISPALLKDAEEGYTIMLFLQAAHFFYQSKFDRCTDTMFRFLDKYPNDDAVPQAKCLLGMALYEGGKQKEGERILNELAKNKKAGIFQEKARMYLAEKKGKK